jgi:hypothetical protein
MIRLIPLRWRRAICRFVVELFCGEDIMWDNDDVEQPFYRVEEWADISWGGNGVGDFTTVTMQRAFYLQNRTYKVTIAADKDGDEYYQVDRI